MVADGREWPVVDGVATVTLLPPRTEIDWAIHVPEGILAEGTTKTGRLPALVDVELSGSLPGVGLLGLPIDCGTLLAALVLVVDPVAPEVLWYEDLAGDEGLRQTVIGATWVGNDVWAIVGRDSVVGVSLDGAVLGRFEHPAGLPLHHDLVWRDDRLFSLDAEVDPTAPERWVTDGIVDLTSAERTWALRDHVSPAGGDVLPGGYWESAFGPGAIDWSHANTLAADGDGWLVSFRHLDAIARLDADGGIDWVLGAPDSPLGSDFTWATEVPGAALDLRGQHHATRLPDGSIGVFDNRVSSSSRVLKIRLDGETATITDVWTLDRTCLVQGGAYWLDDGGVVATCSSDGLIVAFDADGSERGRLSVSCALTERPARGLIRATPLPGLP